MSKDIFIKYSSKIPYIYIPIPNYKFFHAPSDVEKVDPNYIKRAKAEDTFKQWISDKNGNKSGSYLVTGFRGMGKSSFVGKVVSELKNKKHLRNPFEQNPTSISKFGRVVKACLMFLFIALLLTFACLYIVQCDWFDTNRDILYYSCVIVTTIIFGSIYYALIRSKISYIHHIKLNLGDEINNLQDVFALLAHSIKSEYENFVKGDIVLTTQYCLQRALPYLVAALILPFSMVCVSNMPECFQDIVDNCLDLDCCGKSILSLLFGSDMDNVIIRVFIHILISYLCAHILIILIYKIAEYFKMHIFFNHDQFIKCIDNLIDRINSSLDEDSNSSGAVNTASININLFKKKTKRFQPATTREIEDELKSIINYITKSKSLNNRYLFVFDELDKLTCDFVDNKDNPIADNYSPSYERTQKIFRLLGQLKYFTTSTNAKFVFIAGHELYDAYLADVSDREFFVSSMFNGVINIDSFFTSDNKNITYNTEKYICKLLRHNTTDTIIDFHKRINRYYREYFNDEKEESARPLSEFVKTLCFNSDEGKISNEKIVLFIDQFITYLTFVSNGAPKKLTTYLQKYIVTKKQYNKEYIEKKNHYQLPIKPIFKNGEECKSDYYLRFSYNDQQKIGFIHYIAHPIFENIINQSSEYSDKMLVSSAFMIAHIYKLHGNGFSWRSIEYLPEITDSGKTPQLREFLAIILNYLSKIHLTTITSGIYTHKFPMRLCEEISTFTKRSEEISAIFNFSLDDTRQVKEYYNKLLNMYNDSKMDIANINHYLGDIHMACEEYIEAIVQYKMAMNNIVKEIDLSIDSSLNRIKNEGNTTTNSDRKENRDIDKDISSLIVRYTRVALKLGLCYEKRKTNDSAFMTYNDLVLKLIKHRDMDEGLLGLVSSIEYDPKYRPFANEKIIATKKGQKQLDNKEFERNCLPPELDYSDSNHSYWVYGDEFKNKLCDFITPMESALISKLAVYEDLRIAYMPILAKLFSVEKSNICGITRDNLKMAESEFNFIYLLTNHNSKYLLEVDFFRKMGDIVFYKNKKFYCGDTLYDAFSAYGFDIKPYVFNYCYRKNIPKATARKISETLLNIKVDEGLLKGIDNSSYDQKIAVIRQNLINIINTECCESRIAAMFNNIPDDAIAHIPSFVKCSKKRCDVRNTNGDTNGNTKGKSCNCTACRYYNRSLLVLRDRLFDNYDLEDASKMKKSTLFIANIDKLKSRSNNDLIQTAMSLDAMGNVTLSCYQESNHINIGYIISLLGNTSNNQDNRSLTNIENAITYYYAAMKYYQMADNIKSTHCVVKIINTLIEYISYCNRCNINSLFNRRDANINSCYMIYQLTSVIKNLVNDAIKSIYRTRDYQNIVEIHDIIDLLNNTNVSMSNISLMPEIEELMLAYCDLKLLLSDKKSKLELTAKLFQSTLFNRYRNDSLTFNRVLSMRFKANANKTLFEEIESSNTLLVPNFNDVDPDQRREFLIIDSIFCLHSILNYYMSTTKRTTLFTDSFCYSVCCELIEWVSKLDEERKKSYNHKLNLDKKLKHILENNHNVISDRSYLHSLRDMYKKQAIQMHNEGEVYQNFIKELYLVDDDLQNDTCQFYLSLERYKLNNGKLDCDTTENVIDNIDYFNVENYY